MSKKARTSGLAFFKSFSPSILAFLIIPVILLGLWQIPQWLLSSKKISTPDKQAELENAYRATLVQTLGGVFFFVTAWLTWRNVKVTEEKQLTERFSKAVELLGSDKLEVRLGGIYALERIAKDSEKDYWTIMEILTSFVKEKSPIQPFQNIQHRKVTLVESFLDEQPDFSPQKQENQKITTEVQAALTVVGRRDPSKEQESQYIKLSITNLREADLSEANLSEADLSEADLFGANLSEANLFGANLIVANLIVANLFGADLIGANLSEANLSEAIALTSEQISKAITDEKTKLPTHLQAPMPS